MNKFGSKTFDYKTLEEIYELERIDDEPPEIETIDLLNNDSNKLLESSDQFNFEIILDKPINIELPNFYYKNPEGHTRLTITFLYDINIIDFDSANFNNILTKEFRLNDWVELVNNTKNNDTGGRNHFVIYYNINKDSEYFSNILVIPLADNMTLIENYYIYKSFDKFKQSFEKHYNENKNDENISFIDCIRGGKYYNTFQIPLEYWFNKEPELVFPPILYNKEPELVFPPKLYNTD